MTAIEQTPLAGGTKIEWADYTFNPWWGCEKVSPGCAHCYAETLANRRQPGKTLWGEGHAFRWFGDAHWAEPLKWARLAPAKLGRRPRVFCASMADVFEHTGDIHLDGQRRRLFDLILRTPELDWLVLTKRPEFARDWLPEVESFALVEAWPILNLWLGVSIENARFTWRADVLREIPAAVRFISAEPLLGSLFVNPPARAAGREGMVSPRQALTGAEHGPDGGVTACLDAPSADAPRGRKPLDLEDIDWVIVGGESGPGARSMALPWARELVDACRKHDVAPFVKQLGAKPVGGLDIGTRFYLPLKNKKGGDWDEWPDDLRVREFPRSAAA